jgi:hypothetical protein
LIKRAREQYRTARSEPEQLTGWSIALHPY